MVFVMDLIQYIYLKDLNMVHDCLHHIHIKYKGSIYTIDHEFQCISLDDLQKMIDIIRFSKKGVKNGSSAQKI